MSLDPQVTPCIVPATAEHLADIAQLASVIWRACYPGIISTEQIDYMLARMYALETLREELQQGVCYDRLNLGDRMIGFAAYGPTDAPPTIKLHKLYLLPECHGRGLGTALLQHCEQRARALGASRMILTVNKRNAKAIAAYQRNGYHVSASVISDIGQGFVMDDFIMAKDLA